MPKRAVLVVDFQNEYWPTGKMPLHGIEAAAASAARVMAHGRAVGDLVISIRHEQPGAPFFAPDSDGVRINDVVLPHENEFVITKNLPNSFRATSLQDMLSKAGVEEVIVIGAMSHMCVDATTRAANDMGYKTVTIHDACATCDQTFGGITIPAVQVHAAIMAALAFGYGEVISTDELLAR